MATVRLKKTLRFAVLSADDSWEEPAAARRGPGATRARQRAGPIFPTVSVAEARSSAGKLCGRFDDSPVVCSVAGGALADLAAAGGEASSRPAAQAAARDPAIQAAVLRLIGAWQGREKWRPTADECAAAPWLEGVSAKYKERGDVLPFPCDLRGAAPLVQRAAREAGLRYQHKGKGSTRRIVVKRGGSPGTGASATRELRDVFYFAVHRLLGEWKGGGPVDVAGAVAAAESARQSAGAGAAGDALPAPAVLPAGVDASLFAGDARCVTFPPSLTPFQRRQVHMAALELELFHASRGELAARRVIVSREVIAADAGPEGAPSLGKRLKWFDAAVRKPELKPLGALGDAQLAALRAAQRAFEDEPLPRPSEDEVADLRECGGLSGRRRVLVDTEGAFDAMVEELRGCSILAFDVEAHSFRSYHGLTCLLQLASDLGTIFIVDVLREPVWNRVHRLRHIFADAKVMKIAHSVSGCDVPSLYRDFQIVIVNLFDTFEAAKALGLRDVGLAGLLRAHGAEAHVKGMEASKARYQGCDWRARPLSEGMLDYAAMDVALLVPLYRVLRQRLLGYAPRDPPARAEDRSRAAAEAIPEEGGGEGGDGAEEEDGPVWGTDWASEGLQADSFAPETAAVSTQTSGEATGAEDDLVFAGDEEDDEDDEDDDALWDGWGVCDGGIETTTAAAAAAAAEREAEDRGEDGGASAAAAAAAAPPASPSAPRMPPTPAATPSRLASPLAGPRERGESFSGHIRQPAAAARSVRLEDAEGGGVDALYGVLARSQRACAKLWRPRRLAPDSHLKVKEFRGKERAWRGDAARLAAYRELYFWRDRVAREEDESPEYILDSRSLVTCAQLLPEDVVAVLKVSYPLSPYFAATEDDKDAASPPGAALRHVDRIREMVDIVKAAVRDHRAPSAPSPPDAEQEARAAAPGPALARAPPSPSPSPAPAPAPAQFSASAVVAVCGAVAAAAVGWALLRGRRAGR